MRKFLKCLSLTVIFALIISCMSACVPLETFEGWDDSGNTIQDSSEDTTQDDSETVETANASVYCAYERLTSDEKSLYNSLVKEASSFSDEFKFKNIDEDAMKNAYSAVIADHPEFFWLSGGYSYKTLTSGSKKEITLAPITMNMKTARTMSEDFERVVNKIITNAQAMSSVFDKILYIHDYIVENTQYDNDTYNLISSGQEINEVLVASTAYGCLVAEKAVCSGYSAAFQYLAQKLGFKCGRVSGNSKDGENHEWNYILLDDEYYFVDVTWDDPVAADGTSNSKGYEYFCITTDELLLTHIIGSGQTAPNCSGEKYNYFYYTGLLLDQYSFEKAENIINSYINSDKIGIKFSSASECEKAKSDLIDNRRIYGINERFATGVSYYVGSSGLVLYIM